MAIRTMSLPRRSNHYDDDDSGFIRSNGSKNQHESFSLHGTLKRNGGSSHFNTTLEDDVFDDSISAPNSAKPLLHDKPLFPHLYASFGKSFYKLEYEISHLKHEILFWFTFQMEEIHPLLQGLDVLIRHPYPLYGTQSVIPDPLAECTIQTQFQDSVFRIPTTRPCVNVRVQRLPAVSWTPLNQKPPRHPHPHW